MEHLLLIYLTNKTQTQDAGVMKTNTYSINTLYKGLNIIQFFKLLSDTTSYDLFFLSGLVGSVGGHC